MVQYDYVASPVQALPEDDIVRTRKDPLGITSPSPSSSSKITLVTPQQAQLLNDKNSDLNQELNVKDLPDPLGSDSETSQS